MYKNASEQVKKLNRNMHHLSRWTTLATGIIVGGLQGIQHGQVGLKDFKKAQQGDVYESM